MTRNKRVRGCLDRAFLSGVPNVPNAKYLAHLTHQTQKQALISRSKSQKIWNMSIVPSQIWDGTDNNAITVCLYLICFFSLQHHFSLSGSPSATHLSLSLSVAFSPRHLTTLRERDHPGSLLITDPLCNEEELQCEGHGGRKWKLPSATATKAVVLIWLSLLKGNKHWRRRGKKKVSVYV